MKTLFQIAIVVLLVWFAAKWWKHRKAMKAQEGEKAAAGAALGASTKVGSQQGSSDSVWSPPTQLDYEQPVAPPTGGMSDPSSPRGIFSGCN